MDNEHHLPWAVTREDFARAAGALGDDAACCVFIVDDSIPIKARTGYSALVMAYARSAEPVTVLSGGGAALLIRDGGLHAAQIAAHRVISQAGKLGLEHTIRAGTALIGRDADAAIDRAREAAQGGRAGDVTAAADP